MSCEWETREKPFDPAPLLLLLPFNRGGLVGPESSRTRTSPCHVVSRQAAGWCYVGWSEWWGWGWGWPCLGWANLLGVASVRSICMHACMRRINGMIEGPVYIYYELMRSAVPVTFPKRARPHAMRCDAMRCERHGWIDLLPAVSRGAANKMECQLSL
jgi:hypothetical protein